VKFPAGGAVPLSGPEAEEFGGAGRAPDGAFWGIALPSGARGVWLEAPVPELYCDCAPAGLNESVGIR
jgi:hypothetical protein